MRDIRTWSGTAYFTKESVQRHLGAVTDLSPSPVNLFPWKVKGKLVQLATGKRSSYHHDVVVALRHGEYFSRELARGEYDLIFAPSASASLAYLETDIPVIYFSDATWHIVQDYYACYSNLTERTARAGEEIERRALKKASLALFSSEWAAESAIHHYGVDPANVHVISMGANLLNPPARTEVLPRTLGSRLRLLLVGVSWEIKGGEIAYGTLLRLLEMGIDAELTVVGCSAPDGVSHPRMQVIPFLNKQIPAEREKFESLWHDADFFILPTRFEATAIVFCEASAYGLPSLATATGGVSALVVDGRNGYTLPVDATGVEYADLIASLARDRDRYERLCQTSRQEYEERLNWDSWGRRLAAIVGKRFPDLGERLPV